MDFDELIISKITGQLESIVIDFDEKEKIIVNVDNNGDAVSFPIYEYWTSSRDESKFPCLKINDLYLCSQKRPSVFDSIFKEPGSDIIKIRRDGSMVTDEIRIATLKSFEQAKKNLKRKIKPFRGEKIE